MKKVISLLCLFACLLATAQSWNSIDFDVVASTCSNSSGEIFISEIYDCQSGNYGVVELYNPTTNPITLTGVYELKKYARPGATSTTTPLIGVISAQSTFVFVVLANDGSSNSCLCPGIAANQTTTNTSMGFNAQDEFELLKNSTTVIDNMIESNNVVGYTYRRNPNAIAPKATYAAADWTYINQNNNTIGCADLGAHYTPISIIDVERYDDPPTYSMCKIPAKIRIPVENGSGQYERSINGGAFTNHLTPWVLPDLTTAMIYTVIIRDKINPGCSVTITFEIEPDSTVSISDIELN